MAKSSNSVKVLENQFYILKKGIRHNNKLYNVANSAFLVQHANDDHALCILYELYKNKYVRREGIVPIENKKLYSVRPLVNLIKNFKIETINIVNDDFESLKKGPQDS